MIAKESRELVINSFYGIFNNEKTNPLPEDEYDNFFDAHLTDGSVSLEDYSEGDCYLKLNSMNAVINYLTQNPEKQICNFSGFESEVYDIQTFVDFLISPPGCVIKAVVFDSRISELGKEALAYAVTVRAETNTPLLVKWI